MAKKPVKMDKTEKKFPDKKMPMKPMPMPKKKGC